MFHFKQFSIAQDRCAMKVGTDSILLGSWIAEKQATRILDIGSGSGVLSLMMAQKFEKALIYGIEIDPEACMQARENIAASPWPDRVFCIEGAIEKFEATEAYDLILSNPPYFPDDLPAKGKARTWARQGRELDLSELVKQIDRLLAHKGSAHIILPNSKEEGLKELLETYRLFPWKITYVYPKAGKKKHRLLISFGKEEKELIEDELCIQVGGANEYSEAYKGLTQEFYKHSLI